MELLCNCKRLKARTYIRADTLHLLYKFHGLSFYSMWVDFDLQVLYMSITGPRSHRLAILELHWRLPTDPGGGSFEKLGPDFFEDLPWTNFSELPGGGGKSS